MNRIFDRISKPFIGMRQIIWRSKAAVKLLLPHAESRKISQTKFNRLRIFIAISKRLIQLRQMISRWKAYENVLFSHVESFF